MKSNGVKLISHLDIMNTAVGEFKRLGIIQKHISRFHPYKSYHKNVQVPIPVYIPAKISENKAATKCAFVRKNGRFPTVTYVHNKKGVNKNKPKGWGCAIFRSAEPTSDLIG